MFDKVLLSKVMVETVKGLGQINKYGSNIAMIVQFPLPLLQ